MDFKGALSTCELLRTLSACLCQNLSSFALKLMRSKETLKETFTTWVINSRMKSLHSLEKAVQAIILHGWLSLGTLSVVLSFEQLYLTWISSKTRCMVICLYAALILGTCTRAASFSLLACGSSRSGKRAMLCLNSKWQTPKIWKRQYSTTYLVKRAWTGLSRSYSYHHSKINMLLSIQQEFRSALMQQRIQFGETSTSKWSTISFLASL